VSCSIAQPPCAVAPPPAGPARARTRTRRVPAIWCGRKPSATPRSSSPSTHARRLPRCTIGSDGGPLLLDAAFLVPRARARAFRAQAAREARALAKDGYGLTLTGPWPPYTFVQD